MSDSITPTWAADSRQCQYDHLRPRGVCPVNPGGVYPFARRALLRGFNRKKLIVYFVSGLMLKGRQRAQRRDNHLTGAGLRHGLRVVVVPWSAVISDVDRSGVDCAGDCVVGTECGGNRAGPIAERLLDSPMVISPRLVIIRVGQITGASCFSKNSQDSHRYVESLRPVYRFAETPIGTALINSLFGLRLGASFSKHPMHALKCAPNVAIHWK